MPARQSTSSCTLFELGFDLPVTQALTPGGRLVARAQSATATPFLYQVMFRLFATTVKVSRSGELGGRETPSGRSR